MIKQIALILSCIIFLSGCVNIGSDDISREIDAIEITTLTEKANAKTGGEERKKDKTVSYDTRSSEYINNLEFTSLNDENLARYVKDTIYSDLITQLDSDDYFIEDIETVYVSKEYIDELEYNSKENIFFGYTLSELDKQFQGKKYIFTLDENGQTTVKEFEKYDDTYDKAVKNVALGTGVIFICVTVSVVSGGAGVPAVSMIFATSAETATVYALSAGTISGISAGIIEGIKTQDFDKALKSAALNGSENFMWAAVAGSLIGGLGETIALKGATMNGLTMNEAAAIQKESKYPLDVIKQFKSVEQYEICKNAGITPEMVNGKMALIRNIDLDYYDEATKLTNLQRMQKGMPALDPLTGEAYELHHIGQKADSTLAILTKSEHRLSDNYKIWHELDDASEINRPEFAKIRKEFWKEMAEILLA